MSTAILFPGQGSQERGMGRDLAEKRPEAMALWKQAERLSNIGLREIYWEGDESAMADTRNLQPALTVVNLTLWAELSRGLKPLCAAGHSLGEYSALAAAGVLSVENVLSLVALRGRLMSEADPHGAGSMAAVVKLPLAEVEAIVEETAKSTEQVLVIANYNTPGQFVVSGAKGAIEALAGPVKERKGRCLPLAVSGAFHSPLMREAGLELGKALDSLGKSAWNHARFPVLSNATARPETDCRQLKENLMAQMTSSVLWIPTIENIWGQGGRIFVECGPKTVLTKMVGQILCSYGPAESAEGPDGGPAWNAVGVSDLAQIEEFLK